MQTREQQQQAMQQQAVNYARQELAAGRTPQHIPPGWKVENGQLVYQGSSMLPLYLMLAAGLGGPAIAGLAGAGSAGAAGGAGATSIIGNPALATPLEALPGAAAGGAAATTAAAATPSTLDRILKWVKPGLAATSLIGGAAGQQGSNQIPPELQRILDLQSQRMQSQNPLFEQVNQQAFNRLPTYATEGLSQPSMANAASQVPASTPNANTPPGLQEILRQQEIRMRTGDPILQAIQRLAQMRLPTQG